MYDHTEEVIMIKIDPNSEMPIHEQLTNGIIILIVREVLRENDKLPSVRELASIQKINPTTVQKSYKKLEEMEVITSIRGKGYFVNNVEHTVNIQHEKYLLEFKHMVKKLKELNVSKDQINLVLSEILEEN
jgi:GntR family transcriptional regulator